MFYINATCYLIFFLIISALDWIIFVSIIQAEWNLFPFFTCINNNNVKQCSNAAASTGRFVSVSSSRSQSPCCCSNSSGWYVRPSRAWQAVDSPCSLSTHRTSPHSVSTVGPVLSSGPTMDHCSADSERVNVYHLNPPLTRWRRFDPLWK